MNKYIFLDIDGVFNNIFVKEFVNEKAMDNLAYIICETDAKLVVISSQSSNWIREDYYYDENIVKRRNEFETLLLKSCKKLGFNYDFSKVDFIDKYFDLYELYKNKENKGYIDINLSETLKSDYYGSRQYKIDEYLKYYHKKNLLDIRYIVIDDMSDFYSYNCHIKTNAFVENAMLSKEDAKRGVSILNR